MIFQAINAACTIAAVLLIYWMIVYSVTYWSCRRERHTICRVMQKVRRH